MEICSSARGGEVHRGGPRLGLATQDEWVEPVEMMEQDKCVEQLQLTAAMMMMAAMMMEATMTMAQKDQSQHLSRNKEIDDSRDDDGRDDDGSDDGNDMKRSITAAKQK